MKARYFSKNYPKNNLELQKTCLQAKPPFVLPQILLRPSPFLRKCKQMKAVYNMKPQRFYQFTSLESKIKKSICKGTLPRPGDV